METINNNNKIKPISLGLSTKGNLNGQFNLPQQHTHTRMLHITKDTISNEATRWFLFSLGIFFYIFYFCNMFSIIVLRVATLSLFECNIMQQDAKSNHEE